MANEIAGTGVACPECGDPCDHVIDTRKKEGYVSRRRECISCGNRVSTREIPIELDYRVRLTVPITLRWSRTTLGFVAESPEDPAP